jgi:uncharacterized cupin superfamily protein
MVEEAHLEALDSGLAPVSEGWFVVNVAEAAWLTNEAFGARCVFETDRRLLGGHPDREPQRFDQVGITLAVVPPSRPSGLYHAESNQEDFLVLAGECLLLIDDEERPLKAWDFVHCPPGTAHCFVVTGTQPCAILMTGRRTTDKSIRYPGSDLARLHNASVEAETTSPAEAYAAFPHWAPGRNDWNPFHG